MAGTTHLGKRLLLLLMISFIRTGINGKDGLKFKERGYDVTYPCEEDLVCFYMWQISTSKATEYFAIISNGEIQKAASEDKKCAFQMKDLKEEDVGQHHCQQSTPVFSLYNTPSVAPELNLMPGKTVSLQCIFLTYVEQGRCYTQKQQRVSLKWVDEVGNVIEEDSQHLIKQQSSCNITLTVSFHTTGKKIFRCQATVAEQVETSLDIPVGASGVGQKGRRFFLEPAYQGDSQYMIGGAVGVVGCVVLTAVVVLFVMNKRRTNSQLPDGQCSVQSNTNNVMNTDDVIYADIIPPTGSDRVWVHECESTEYACVQY